MWQELLARLKATKDAVVILWQDPQTHDTMRFYASILVVIGLLYGLGIYRAAKRRRTHR